MTSDFILFDAGVFIGALLLGDARHSEARPLVEAARRGEIFACTTAGILSEVYAALTWQQAQPQHSPQEASAAVSLLIEQPSAIKVLESNREVAQETLRLAVSHQLKARRIHDARHAAAAIAAGVSQVFTYDVQDWQVFEPDGVVIAGPASTLALLNRTS